jgi:hypothetical protein
MHTLDAQFPDPTVRRHRTPTHPPTERLPATTRSGFDMTRSPQETFAAHFAALTAGDLKRVLDDYSEDAVIITDQGVLTGQSGVEAFYMNALELLPEPRFAVTNAVYADDAALVNWTAQSPAGRVDDGVDTFVFSHDRIRLHTTHFTLQQLGH